MSQLPTDFLDVPLARILRTKMAAETKDRAAAGVPDIPGIETIHLLRVRDALSLRRLPKTMAVIGAGSTGCEIAALFATIGSRVLLVERAASVLPREDEEVSAIVGRGLADLGVEVAAGAEILEAINATGAVYGLRVRCGDAVETHALEAVVLAEDREESGPRVTLTLPEAASVGMTAAEAAAKYGDALVGRCDISSIARAAAERLTVGFVKIVAHPKTRKIVGCSIVADRAGELIHEAALAIHLGTTVDKVAAMAHAGSTWSEGIALAASNVKRR